MLHGGTNWPWNCTITFLQVGDLGNIEPDANGVAKGEIVDRLIKLSGEFSVPPAPEDPASRASGSPFDVKYLTKKSGSNPRPEGCRVRFDSVTH